MDAERAAGAWRFDRFTLDLARGALLGPDGVEVPLRPKSFALLRLLVENPGRLVDRDAIMAAVWPDVVVGDESITQCIRDIRKALGDEAQQVLKTVPKRGYLFAAEVTPAESTAPTPRVERRLAAIMAADIVGYSRLIKQDEAATLAAIKGLREQAIDPLLAEHKGRIVKLMGDGAIVEFASVVDAVACAVAIQKAVADRQAKTPADRRIVFRIGVNLGDVVVEGDDLMGDGVNIAARLEQLCEPGGVLVSGTAYDHLQGRLGMPLEFTGEQQVKNIARPVRTYRVRLDGVDHLGPARTRETGTQSLVLTAAALLGLALVSAGGWWWLQPRDPIEGAPDVAPSVVVLPFENVSGDERLGRLADGMVTDIIDSLSIDRVITVIARGTSFRYRDPQRDVGTIARDLDVNYVVDGAVQGNGQRLRATVELIDPRKGVQLWSERFDRPLEDLFAVQDELTQRIAEAIARGPILATARTAARQKSPESLEAHELRLLAIEQRQRWTAVGINTAIQLLQRAIKLQPHFSEAYAELAYCYKQQIDTHSAASIDRTRKEWLDAARTAVDLDSTYPWAHMALAMWYMYASEHERAAPELEKALQLGAGNADIMATVAVQLTYLGQSERAVELLDRAVRLDPGSDRGDDEWQVYFFARRFNDALAAMLRQEHNDHWRLLCLTLTYAELGRSSELEQSRLRLKGAWPAYSRELAFSESGDFGPAATAQRQLSLESHLKAGLPVCATPEQLSQYRIKPLPECDAERARELTTERELVRPPPDNTSARKIGFGGSTRAP